MDSRVKFVAIAQQGHGADAQERAVHAQRWLEKPMTKLSDDLHRSGVGVNGRDGRKAIVPEFATQKGEPS